MCLLATEVAFNFGETVTTVAIGFVVVFLVLLLLTGIFKAFGMIMSRAQAKQSASAPTAKAAAPAPAAVAAPAVAPIVGNTQQVSSKPDVDGGVPAETVAVISAAVASVAPAGTQYAVKGIRKL